METLYWLTVIGNLKILCIALCFIVCLVIFIALMGYANDEIEHKAFFKTTKIATILGVIGVLGICFIPTKKELLLIYGGGTIVDYVRSSDKCKQIPDKTLNIIIKKLEELEDNENNKNKHVN